MALAHKVVVLSSCCAVAYLNPDEKTKRCFCSKLNVSEAPELALAFAAELGSIKFQGDMEKVLISSCCVPGSCCLLKSSFSKGVFSHEHNKFCS